MVPKPLQVSSFTSPSWMRSLACSCSVTWVHFAAWQQDEAPRGCQHSLFANRVRVQRPSWPVERVHLVPEEPESLGMGLQSRLGARVGAQLFGAILPLQGRVERLQEGGGAQGIHTLLVLPGQRSQTAQLGVAK